MLGYWFGLIIASCQPHDTAVVRIRAQQYIRSVEKLADAAVGGGAAGAVG